MVQQRKLPSKKFQIDSLDGLRGLAVLLVFLSHTSNEGIYLFPFADFSGVGKSGVFLFFVLSSFLLTLPFIKQGKKAFNPRFLLNYFFRRFWRIYPLYSLYLLLALVTSLTVWRILDLQEPWGIPFVLSGSDFLQQLLLAEGKGITWSILVEFRYYFILPFLALIYSIVFKNKLLPSVALTIVLVVLSQIIWPPSESVPNDSRIESYLSIFFIGSLLALIFHKWNQQAWKNRQKVLLTVDILGFAALIILFCLIPAVSSLILGKQIAYDYYHRQFVLFGLLWSVVLFSCVSGSGVLKNIFELPFLRYMGFISFSFYLLHFIVVTNPPRIPLQGWIMLIMSIVMAHISWTIIEKPTAKVRLFQK